MRRYGLWVLQGWHSAVSTTEGQFQQARMGCWKLQVLRLEAVWGQEWLAESASVTAQVSFANAICTYKGGTHVNYILDQVTK